MNFKRLVILATIASLTACSTTDPTPTPSPEPGPGPGPGPGPEPPVPTVVTSDDVELSYWVDCDMLGYHRRGYWYEYAQYSPESKPAKEYMTNAVNIFVDTYNANLIYVFYHRQFEIETAKEVMLMWKEAAKDKNVKLVPTVLLQDYSKAESMNFTDDEIISFAKWCKENMSDEFGIFDVYSRQQVGGLQSTQIAKIKAAIGDCLVLVGIQPNTALNASFHRAVEDTWTAECQGLTNDWWSTPVGGQIVGKTLLLRWVNERVGLRKPFTFDIIIVAWDYEKPADKYGYVCPGDDAAKNDPMVPGRAELCWKAILSKYPTGYDDPSFGGFSSDLTILHANTMGCGDKQSFYLMIRQGKIYDGKFGQAALEVARAYADVKADFISRKKN